jgi:hypothetical protein
VDIVAVLQMHGFQWFPTGIKSVGFQVLKPAGSPDTLNAIALLIILDGLLRGERGDQP